MLVEKVQHFRITADISFIFDKFEHNKQKTHSKTSISI